MPRREAVFVEKRLDIEGATSGPLAARVAAPSTLEQAFSWLCERRRDWPDHADVWALRRDWPQEKQRIQKEILSGRFRFGLLSGVLTATGGVTHIWSARDALVLKALAVALGDILPVAKCCTHVKGHGGLKGTVRQAAVQAGEHWFVLRTDVKSYYDSINFGLLIDRLKRHVCDERVLGLIRQYLYRTVECGGVFQTFTRGISRGCPLSPLIGAFFLGDLDQRMERQATREGLFYVRYMDDILVLAPSRWKLRRAVALVNEQLAAVELEKHPDKTFIGRISRGFDFLGYRFSVDASGQVILTLAAKTMENFQTKLSRLYEQLRRCPPQWASALEARITSYMNRFLGWACGGVGDGVMVADRIVGDVLCGGLRHRL